MKHFKLFVKKAPANKDKFNKNLLTFLINNVEEIVSSGIFIKIILVNEKNINAIHSLNITSTPALYCENKTLVGVKNIIEYLIDICENGESAENQTTNKNKRQKEEYEDEGDVKNMLTNIINSGDDEDDEELNNDDIRRKMSERLNGYKNESFSTKKTSDSFSRLKKDNEIQIDSIQMDMSSSGDIVADDAMSKYWANLEETDI